MDKQEEIEKEIQKKEREIREEIKVIRFYTINKWQFICDSAYDLFHLWARFGQKTPRGWWQVRLSEWFGMREYNRRLSNGN